MKIQMKTKDAVPRPISEGGKRTHTHEVGDLAGSTKMTIELMK